MQNNKNIQHTQQETSNNNKNTHTKHLHYPKHTAHIYTGQNILSICYNHFTQLCVHTHTFSVTVTVTVTHTHTHTHTHTPHTHLFD